MARADQLKLYIRVIDDCLEKKICMSNSALEALEYKKSRLKAELEEIEAVS